MIYESEKFVDFQPKSVTLLNELADKHYVNICILCNVFHNFFKGVKYSAYKKHIYFLFHMHVQHFW